MSCSPWSLSLLSGTKVNEVPRTFLYVFFILNCFYDSECNLKDTGYRPAPVRRWRILSQHIASRDLQILHVFSWQAELVSRKLILNCAGIAVFPEGKRSICGANFIKGTFPKVFFLPIRYLNRQLINCDLRNETLVCWFIIFGGLFKCWSWRGGVEGLDTA